MKGEVSRGSQGSLCGMSNNHTSGVEEDLTVLFQLQVICKLENKIIALNLKEHLKRSHEEEMMFKELSYRLKS